jgi:sucrose-6-phosphate hydrolase SacC (GH32 family)
VLVIYVIGSLDGKAFKAESTPQRLQQGNAWFASQTFSDIPASDGRRILIPWECFAGDNEPLYKDMLFTQMMGIPVERKLRTTETGPRLFAYSVEEVSSLRDRSHRIDPQILEAAVNPLDGIRGELFDIDTEITPAGASEISFNRRAAIVTYNVKAQELLMR